MKFYYVDRRDIELIGKASLRAALAFGVGSFLLSIWLGVTTGVAFSNGPLTPEGVAWERTRPYMLFASLAVYAYGAYELWSRGSWWRMLREEHNETFDIFGREVKRTEAPTADDD